MQDPQDKGRGDIVADIHPLGNVDGRRHLPPQPQPAESRPSQQHCHSRQPDISQGHQGHSGPVRFTRSESVNILHSGFHQDDDRLPVQAGQLVAVLDQLPALGPETQSALRQHRAQKACRHQAPQQAMGPFGHAPPRQGPNGQYRQHQHPGGDAHSRQLQEDPAEHGSFPDRGFCAVKAATKAGREPWNALSTNCSLRREANSSRLITEDTTPFTF